MKKILLFLTIVFISCQQQIPTVPIAPVTVYISTEITWDSPYDDLTVVMDMDSIVRTYTSDTLDSIELQPGTKVAFLYYKDGRAGQMQWIPVTVVSDTIVYFKNEILLRPHISD